VQRLHRQYPVKAGTGTCFETVDRPDLRAFGVGLLEALGWQGVACIELLEDERDGVVKLMEINPRFWGTLALAIQAGVDFPYLLYRVATEGDVEPHMDYNIGEVCRWMLPGEILHFLSNGRRWHLEPSFWRFRGPNVGYCLLSRKDVRPVFAFFWIAFRSLFDKEMLDFVFRRL
ncbi:MAG: ATP-grasp domain-containing protein, partial [Candidatus Tectimicrobiota bacterium]